MCGFGGVVHWNREPVEPNELGRMSFSLKHRGPDESCIARPTEWVGLGHCRLRIIDLSSAARQPMTNEDGTVWLVYNGEIYNFLELREELKARGMAFRSRSDTEVILRAYEAWGKEGIPRLEGMFALALWDSRIRELLVARDRTGKKPLYYRTSDRCTVFGSEIKALLVHPHVPRRLNERVLPHLLALGYPPTGQTCYEEIRQVPPAAFLCFRPDETQPTPKTYWHLPTLPIGHRTSLQDTTNELQRLLTDSVRRRLIADVPLGAFLSGGIDSTLVVGLMTKLAPGRPVKTFSIDFEGDPRFNETHYAQLAADRFHTDHTLFTVGPQSFDLLEQLVWHYDQPFGDSSALPMYLLSKWTRERVTVALSGDGGDELFAGYIRFRTALLSERMPMPLRRLGSWIFRQFPMGSTRRSTWGRLRRFFEVAQEPVGTRFLRWNGFFSNPEEFLTGGKDLPAEDVFRTYGKALESSSGTAGLSQLLSFNFQEYLPNDLLVKTDRCSMAHGLEIRSPFLDTALTEWAFRLPNELKLRGSVSKWILRRAFRNLLPVAIRHRAKMGFGVPLEIWFRGKWKEPLQDYLSSSQPRIGRYLKARQVQQLVQQHLQGHQDASHPLWLLLTLEVWLRQMEQRLPDSTSLPEVIPIPSLESPV